MLPKLGNPTADGRGALLMGRPKPKAFSAYRLCSSHWVWKDKGPFRLVFPWYPLKLGCGMLPVLQQEVSEANVAATGDTVWEVIRTENHCEAPYPGTLQERGSQRGWRTPGDKAH